MKLSKIVNPFMRFSRLTRIRVYLTNLEEVYKPSKKKIRKVEGLKEQLDKTLIKASLVSWLRNFFNLIIYASAISALSSIVTGIDLAFIGDQLSWVAGIIGGTAVAIIGAAIATRFVNLYIVDLMLLASTIIAVYTSPEDDIDKINVFKIK